jgi:transposase
MARITLSAAERSTLETLIQTTRDARVLKRAQAFVWLDAGEPVTAVARRLRVSRQTIYTWLARYQQLDNQPLAQRLADQTRSRAGQGRMWVAARDLVQAVIDKPPSQYGYDVPLWTTPLLQDYLSGKGVSISTRYIRRLLRALDYRAKRPRYRLARRSATWRQATRGSSAGGRVAGARSFLPLTKPS